MKIAAPAYCKDGVFNVMPALCAGITLHGSIR